MVFFSRGRIQQLQIIDVVKYQYHTVSTESGLFNSNYDFILLIFISLHFIAGDIDNSFLVDTGFVYLEKEMNGDADSTHSSLREMNDVAFTNGDIEPLVLTDTHESVTVPEAVYTSVVPVEDRVVKELVPVQKVVTQNVVERVPVATRVIKPAPVVVSRPVEVRQRVVSPVPRIVKPVSTIRTVERVVPMPVHVNRVVEKVMSKPVVVQKVVQPVRQTVIAEPVVQRVVTRAPPVQRVITAPMERVLTRAAPIERVVAAPVERVVTRAAPVERVVAAPVERLVTAVRSRPVERMERSYTLTRSSTPRSRSLVYMSRDRAGSARTIHSTYSTIPRYSEVI